MKAFVFPGQGAQFPGMGKDLFEASTIAKEMFNQANDILKFNITDIMFGEDNEALMQTKVTLFKENVQFFLVLGRRFIFLLKIWDLL